MDKLNQSISAVIITFNVENTIEACLKAVLAVCQEVLVLDSSSTDRTVEICQKLGVRIVDQEWLGYAQTKNEGHKLASNDWILSIDSDEVLSDELIKSLHHLQLEDDKVYSLDRLTNYCGKWIHHCGWYPEWKVRLFNKKHISWKGDYVHETLDIPAHYQRVKLKGKLYHYSYKDAADHLKRIEKYARLSAQERFEAGKKPSFVKRYFSPPARFIRTYFIKKGFLDGKAGWLISIRSAYMIKLRYSLLNELWRAKK